MNCENCMIDYDVREVSTDSVVMHLCYDCIIEAIKTAEENSEDDTLLLLSLQDSLRVEELEELHGTDNDLDYLSLTSTGSEPRIDVSHLSSGDWDESEHDWL